MQRHGGLGGSNRSANVVPWRCRGLTISFASYEEVQGLVETSPIAFAHDKEVQRIMPMETFPISFVNMAKRFEASQVRGIAQFGDLPDFLR